MRLLGLQITKAAPPASLAPPMSGASNGWWLAPREPFSGAWQMSDRRDLRRENLLTYNAVFACVTIIAHDISKLRIKLMQQSSVDLNVWTETTSPAFSPVLTKPNNFQNRIQFLESWMLSKLTHGNTYILKERDNRSVVTDLYVLDPARVVPLVADDGSVFYQLNVDNLSGVQEAVTVPASEIIHDRFNCLYHPLVGLSPIVACGMAAAQGMNIQQQSERLFRNNARPSGVLTAPGRIDADTVERLRGQWEQNYSGDNSGRVAILGSDMKFQSITMTAVDAQLIQQLQWSASVACSVFHVPPYKVAVGDQPAHTNVQALNIEYFSQCVQRHIEDIELCLDEGLGLSNGLGVEMDVDNLLRMDTPTLISSVVEGLKGVLTPNEGRSRLGLAPKTGGDTPYLQQQNFSLEALSKRDARDDPFASAAAGAGAEWSAAPDRSGSAPPPAPAEDTEDDQAKAQANLALLTIYRGLL